ncbi:MAG TPA: hypothetical protein VGP07_13570 [Polyangia bacterium]|jgi:hypothetical protein
MSDQQTILAAAVKKAELSGRTVYVKLTGARPELTFRRPSGACYVVNGFGQIAIWR